MRAKRSLVIVSKCDRSWDDLLGNEHRRHCDTCNRQVHNISAMSAGEARTLLDKAGLAGASPPCIRLQRSADGRVVFRSRMKPWRRLFAAVLSAALTLFRMENASAEAEAPKAEQQEAKPPATAKKRSQKKAAKRKASKKKTEVPPAPVFIKPKRVLYEDMGLPTL